MSTLNEVKTTPLPPLPPAAKEWCEESCVYFTPADPKYGPLAMQAYATQARADLEAENQRLREALAEAESRLTLLINRDQHKLLDVVARDKARAALKGSNHD